MTPLPEPASRPAAWRRAGAALALAASLGFAFQSSLATAQVIMSDPDKPLPAGFKPAPKPAAARKAVTASRTTATDNVSDDLNRREAERVAKLMQAAAPTPAAAPHAMVATPAVAPRIETNAVEAKPVDASLPPTVAAIPPRAPIVKASLTPGVDVPPVNSQPTPPPAFATTPDPAPVPQPRQAQTRPIAPVPVQPAPATGPTPPSLPSTVTGAPARPFAQSQVVPPQQPTLTLEVHKGTAIKLPGPASTVFVASPDIADVQVKSPGMIYVFAKKPGDTVLYAVDDQDRVLLNTIVTVTSPVSRMRAQLDVQHPGNGVQIENQGEAIVLSGVVRSAVIAEDARRAALQHVTGNAKVINNIKVDAPNQVQLRVKVAEVNRGSLKRVGINWQNINSIALFGLGPITAGFATNTITAAGSGAILPGSARIQAQSNDGSLTSLIDFLATQNQATVLAEPNLIAMSGESASFLAGGEIPVIQPQSGGLSGTITVAYKQVGISLSFTPTIIGERISLKVAPEVSQVTTEGQVSVAVSPTASIIIPAIQTRRASTTVELGSGQSFAIAGLLQNTSQQNIQKMPWLGDVPVLGTLFKSDAYQRQETELVIIVTPYFVEPTSGQLRTPLSGRVPPTDADRLVYQRFNHPTPPQRLSVGREQYAGPSAGFKLD
jgi:pilus assembly protein CpaC